MKVGLPILCQITTSSIVDLRWVFRSNALQWRRTAPLNLSVNAVRLLVLAANTLHANEEQTGLESHPGESRYMQHGHHQPREADNASRSYQISTIHRLHHFDTEITSRY